MPQAGFKIAHFGRSGNTELSRLLREVATQGFVGVETGNLFRTEGDEVAVRRLLSESGLALCGLDAGFAEFADPERLAENLRFVQSLGSRYLVCRGVGDHTSGLTAYREAGKLFNEVGKRCQDAGLVFCYHPHAREFEDLEGNTSGMDVLDHDTNSKLVKYCVDVDELHDGQVDPARFINEHSERAVYFHFKVSGQPEVGRTDALTGAGDLKAAYLAAAALTPEWIVCKPPCGGESVEVGVQQSRSFLRDQLGL